VKRSKSDDDRRPNLDILDTISRKQLHKKEDFLMTRNAKMHIFKNIYIYLKYIYLKITYVKPALFTP